MKTSILNTLADRRNFLKWSCQTALGSSSLLGAIGTLASLGSASVAAQTAPGYRALVCVYLYGGNDAFNLLVPTDTAGYAKYQKARVRLAIPQADLLPIASKTTDGHTYGLHSAATELQSLFAAGHAAFIANVGTLIAPTSLADYRAGNNLPPQLFSHYDQTNQWMTSRPESSDQTGWGGRLADLLQSPNQANGLSMNISIDGNNLFQTGNTTVPYAMNQSGVQDFDRLNSSDPAERVAAFQAMLDQGGASINLLERQQAAAIKQSRALGDTVRGALATAPNFRAMFPANDLGQQLKMVANLIASRSQLGATRQVFFVSMGGFDTHENQPALQKKLFRNLSQALNAFYNATVELGVANSVTTFTESDFGRTLTNNNNGTDHGWGSHHIVVGGGVAGQKIYGSMPDLTIGGASDAGDGRIIPTTSTYQYAATLGQWLGASASDMATIFPNLSRFNQANLGFMR
ncbi:DUF1501 domain-containing protein [Collimonas pratensis]|uniref:DUF1501 domain-containing protein n=1 Tax=Collimonas pratensis TaxID=279113 RepID=UPI00143D581E|nr:DUF1501 domain-containing protein [Collimonas pratensis]NKI70227.1 DUF1501 domain-containing protein [Collimonas pratensis]